LGIEHRVQKLESEAKPDRPFELWKHVDYGRQGDLYQGPGGAVKRRSEIDTEAAEVRFVTYSSDWPPHKRGEDEPRKQS